MAEGAALAPAVVGGLIGGGFVGISVAVGEWLARVRDRRHKLEEAIWAMSSEVTLMANALQVAAPAGTVGVPDQWVRTWGAVGRARTLARFPMLRYRKINAELKAINLRLIVASVRWLTQRPTTLAEARVLQGSHIHELVFGNTRMDAEIDAALQAEGLRLP